MTFKESVEESNMDFFGCDEFAELHSIEYCDVMCVIDTDADGEDANHDQGLKNIRIFLPQTEVDKIDRFDKHQGDSLNVDGSEYLISSYEHEMGVHVISALRYGG